MSDARLTRLVELATRTAPEERRRLAVELCDLLLDWPQSYPAAMREPFETLLEKTLRLIDGETRMRLVARLAEAPDAPLAFLNEFFFDAGPELRAAILERNAQCTATPQRSAVDEPALIAAARAGGDFTASFARALALAPQTAERILRDPTGEPLAIALRGAGLSRAAYSTVALIADGVHSAEENAARLAAYELVPPRAAQALMQFWRDETEARRLTA
ncbi:MAG: DUF2336 domain-containing protein [Rhizomicrobium sp.]